MPQIINTNIPSLNAQRNLNTSLGALNTALQRLSSGLRVNSAKDDAAGMAIAENMNAQSRGMTVAMRNANDGISAAQTAEAGLTAIGGHLQRMRELAVQAASGQYDTVNQAALNSEFQQLNSEIARAIQATNFNGKQLLTGDFTSGVGFQIGATTGQESRIDLSIANFADAITTPPAAVPSTSAPNGNSVASGTQIALNLATLISDNAAGIPNALYAINSVDNILDKVNSARADIGAMQTRFESVLTQLAAAQESTEAARSRIMDADYAAETA
ncbi:MAG: flagellin FliC, partial [Zoogloeaceae bacterium]|nr:flagellin FliC [Zoogloeaceae bacterium]